MEYLLHWPPTISSISSSTSDFSSITARRCAPRCPMSSWVIKHHGGLTLWKSFFDAQISSNHWGNQAIIGHLGGWRHLTWLWCAFILMTRIPALLTIIKGTLCRTGVNRPDENCFQRDGRIPLLSNQAKSGSNPHSQSLISYIATVE